MRTGLFARAISDKFLLLIPNPKGEPAAEWLDGLNQEFGRRYLEKFKDVRIRVCTGVYEIEPGCTSASFAMDAANYACRQISPASVSSVRIFDGELMKKRQMEYEIANGIQEAVKEGRLQVYMQPKISLKDGQIAGAKAVVRWRAEDGSLVSSEAFLPLQESGGRMEELDYFVLEEVAKLLGRNQKLGRRQVPVSVGASILHVSDSMTARKYVEILERHQIDPGFIQIELPERAVKEEYGSVKSWFAQLKQEGMGTAIEGFNAGYAMINAVVEISADQVKLAPKLAAECGTGKQRLVLKKLVEALEELGCHVCCDGVETREQLEILREAGCFEAQGNLIAPLLFMEEYERYVYENKESVKSG